MFIVNFKNFYMNALVFLLAVLFSVTTQAVFAAMQTYQPTNVVSYSSRGILSNFACHPNANNSALILHSDIRPSPAEKYFTVIDERGVTSCAAFDFNASVPTEVIIEYTASTDVISGCTDGCSGNNCTTTGGELEVFFSPDPTVNADGTWKSLTRFTGSGFPRQTSMTAVSVQLPSSIGTVRSVLVCRNGGGSDRADVKVDSIQLKADDSTPVADAPSSTSPYRKAITALGNQAQTAINQQPNQVWNLFYPTPSVYALLSAWIIDHNPEWKSSIERQIQYSHDHRLSHGLPFRDNSDTDPNHQFFFRDQIAREAIAQYHVYEAFNNVTYLHWVDSIVKEMLKLPLDERVYKGKTYHLFYGRYNIPSSSTETPTGYPDVQEAISPNQNAEVGLLLTMLYHNPQSEFYHNPDVSKIAKDELAAAIVLQNPVTGELPLVVYDNPSTGNDTGYASYTASLVAMANVYWNDPEYKNFLVLLGKWFSNWKSAGHFADHTNANNLGNCSGVSVIDGHSCEYGQEMWWRLPAYYAFNEAQTSLGGSYVNSLYQNWMNPNEFAYDGRIVFMKAAGIPTHFYLPSISMEINPRTISSGGTTYATWMAPGMTSCQINVFTEQTGYDGPWDTALNGKSVPNGGLTSNAKWTMTCSAPGVPAQQVSASVDVLPTFSLSTNNIIYSGTSYATWKATGMNSCKIFVSTPCSVDKNLWDTALQGTNVANTVKVKTTYEQNCIARDGTLFSTSATVTPYGAPLSISANPQSISRNGSTNISWSSSGLQSCQIYSSMKPSFEHLLWDTAHSGGPVASGGITSTQNFEMNCIGDNGSEHKACTEITVSP